jgi:hypothetical protein
LNPLRTTLALLLVLTGCQGARIVERALPGYGQRSRYVVRSYVSQGKRRWEQILLFRTATYFAEIRSTSASYDERTFLAFAREVQTAPTAR